jgi:catechol-2,3-dioxygenase
VLHLVEAPAEEAHGPQVAGTFDHAAFTCTDMRAAAARLEKLGVAYRRAAVPGTRSVQFFLQDPAGNGVELNFADAEH